MQLQSRDSPSVIHAALDAMTQSARLVVSADEKENLLFMLVCHLATLASRGSAGSMTSAKEGEVQVSFAAPTATGDAAWYNTTPCGAAYWQIIKKYRLGGMWFPGRKTL